MTYKFFTQDAYISSPTFHKLLDGREDSYPDVNMTADIIFHEGVIEDKDEEEHSVLHVSILNRMWDDPESGEDGKTEKVSIHFDMNRKEAAYLHKFIEAFLENTPKKDIPCGIM